MSETQRERDLRRDDVLTAIQSLLVVVVIATFIVTFILQPFRIPTESMEPTLNAGDFLLMDRQSFAPRSWLDAVLPNTPIRRGDIIVFHFPVDPSIHLIKRVVALPGDRLRLKAGRLYINDRPAEEPYAFFAPSGSDDFRDNFPTLRSLDSNVDPAWWSSLRRNVRDNELFVPAGRYFVMGDNRNNSTDSRYWGFVRRDALVGRPMVVYFSLGTGFKGWLKSVRIVR